MCQLSFTSKSGLLDKMQCRQSYAIVKKEDETLLTLSSITVLNVLTVCYKIILTSILIFCKKCMAGNYRSI